MCTRGQCLKMQGQWVHFRSPWGYHRGIVQGVNQHAVLVRMPRQYAPSGLAHHSPPENASDEQKLDFALAQYGYGPARGGGYGAWGRPGWGGWYGGYYWWWLAFAWLFALAFLW